MHVHNVNPGLIHPLPSLHQQVQKVQKASIDFAVTNPPQNKKTSRPEENWTTIPYYSTSKLLWQAFSKWWALMGGIGCIPY